MKRIIKLPSLKEQVGGSHYKNKHYELAQFSLDVGLNPMIHSAIKYVLRDKNDKAEDLNKAQHCATIFKDWAYIQANMNSHLLNNFPYQMDFDTVATFLSQFEAHEQAAMLALIHLQASVQCIETVNTDLSVSYVTDTSDVIKAWENAIEHIERLK